MARHAPFRAGDPATVEAARRGGKVAAEQRRLKAAADPLTRGLLGELLTYTTDQWMDRLDLTGPSWESWRVLGRVLDGLPLGAAELAVYTQLTGRTTVPTDLRELWCLAGRGPGKTTFEAAQALKAACRGYTGVRGLPRVLLLGFVQAQAEIAFQYVTEFVAGDRELRKLVTRQTRDSVEFAHGVRLQTITSNYRALRGYSVAAALCDEIAYWWSDLTDSNPDVEVIRSLRPALAKVPGSRLLAASTPFTEEGVLYDVHQRHYANDASATILVVKAPTTVLNPAFDAAAIAVARQEDPESAAAEYDVGWRTAGGTLVTPAAYDACVDAGITERDPVPPLGNDYYSAAVDLSGGTGQDSAALSIHHVEDADGSGPEVCVQDMLREWSPPFDPGTMVGEMATACRRFGIVEVVGDQFSEGFAAAEFRRHGIQYVVSPRKTAECLLDSLAVINTHRVRLLEAPKLRRQYLNLRRDYATGGRPTVLESRKHDDLAVVTARGIVACLGLGVEPEVRPKVAFRFGPLL